MCRRRAGYVLLVDQKYLNPGDIVIVDIGKK